MSRKLLLSLAWRLCLGWAVLTAVVAGWHTPLLMQAAGLIGGLAERIMPGYLVELSSGGADTGGGDIVVTITGTQTFSIDAAHSLAPWVPVQESINSVHDLLPLVLLGSFLLAWPRAGWQRRALVTVGVGGLGVAFAIWACAVHVAGLYELSLQQTAEADRLPRDAPWYFGQMLFFEGGGLWAIPIAAGVALCLAQAVGRRGPVVPGLATAVRRPPG